MPHAFGTTSAIAVAANLDGRIASRIERGSPEVSRVELNGGCG